MLTDIYSEYGGDDKGEGQEQSLVEVWGSPHVGVGRLVLELEVTVAGKLNNG
jgi:hypothetical protein